MCILLTHSSENGRFRRSPKPSTAKSRRFSRLSRDVRFVSKLAVSLAKPVVEFDSNVANDLVYIFRESNETSSSSELGFSDFMFF